MTRNAIGVALVALMALSLTCILFVPPVPAAEPRPSVSEKADPIPLPDGFVERLRAQMANGEAVSLLEFQGNRYHVRLSDGGEGWVSVEELEKVDTTFAERLKAQMAAGEAVSLLEVSGDRYRVRLNDGATGWVSRDLLGILRVPAAPVPENRLTVARSSAQVRERPDIGAPVTARREKGDVVDLLEERGEWYRVRMSDGKEGWMNRILFSQREGETRSLLTGVTFEEVENGGVRVIFFGNGGTPPRISTIGGDTPRVVCDFANTQPSESFASGLSRKVGNVNAARVGFQGPGNRDMRVVFDVSGGKAQVRQRFEPGRRCILTMRPPVSGSGTPDSATERK